MRRQTACLLNDLSDLYGVECLPIWTHFLKWSQGQQCCTAVQEQGQRCTCRRFYIEEQIPQRPSRRGKT